MATENCSDCKPTILNKQVSRIATPICNDCGELEVQCDGEYIYTECVKSNVDLQCIDTVIGATQTSINQAIVAKLCANEESNCTASVSAGDTCCGYLVDKIIAGDGITITENTNGSGCKTLVIAEKCWEWNDIAPAGTGDGKFTTGWENNDATGTLIQTAQYSDVKECSVRLRGGIKNATWNGSTTTIFTLPAGKRPLLRRWFHISVDSSTGLYPATLLIFPSGAVIISLGSSDPAITNATTSLDNIQFETN